MRARPGGHTGLAAFAVYAVLIVAWSVATPLMAAPDEPYHVTRAASVVRGELVPKHHLFSGAYLVSVPQGVVSPDGPDLCFAHRMKAPASCAANLHGGMHRVSVRTDAARYYPPYYFLVGWPSLLFTNGAAVYLMRLVSALVCAAFLGSAYATLTALRNHRLLIAGMFVAITPMVLFLSSVLNPNSLEIAAGLAVWASGLALVDVADEGGDDDQRTPRLWRHLTVSSAALLLMRPLSPLWLALSLLPMCYVLGRTRLVALARDRLARRYAAVVGALTIANLTWTEAATPVQHARTTPLQWSFWHILGHVLNRLRTRTVQLFGNFGWLDTSLPFLSIAIYLGLVILLFALTVASPLHRWRRVVAYGFFVTLVLPIVSEVSQARWYGFPWQGRYILPFAVGIPLMAAFALRNGSLLPEAAARRLLVAVTVGVAIAQTGAFWWALDRYQVGAGRSHNPLAGSWHPPVTSGGAIAFFGVGVVMFTAFGVWLARTRERSPLSPLPS